MVPSCRPILTDAQLLIKGGPPGGIVGKEDVAIYWSAQEQHSVSLW